ncbi:MAG: S46 family peptidase [Alistipes sp.]|nr:S46 family peptidase [Alistipes sp.]
MKKFFALLLLCVCFLTPSHADEGMWLPSLIGERIKDMKRKGFKLSAEDIYSINKASMKDAVVQFGGGCTGEFVSKEGLLLTNHHCGYGSIQQLSSVEHDYLTDGFWALSRNEELPVPGLTVSLLVKMEDVTDRIAAGEKAADIAKAAATGEGYRASVEPMYYGNQHFLFVYQTYRDVRLVGAPPSSIGKFGGDTDNWIWPRHTGDFSIFRVYAGEDNQPADYSKNNKPYQPKRHFAVSTKGVKEGDFTMIYGFPGNTQEYVTSDAVEYVAEVSDPMKIELRTQRLDIISAAQAEDVAVRIQYASKHASIANAWKKWQGEVLGLRRLKTVESKKAYEKEFAAWAADKPEYKTLLQDMSASYEKAKKEYFVRELFNESLGGIEALTLANTMLAIKNRAKSAEDLQLNIKMNQGAFLKNYNASIDRKIAHAMLGEFLKRMPADKIPADLTAAIEAKGGATAYVDYLYDNTKIISADFDPATLDSDPMVELATILQPMRREISQVAYRNLSNIPDVEQWYRPYMRALREWDKERAFYPDANFTLRVAYGSVAGYEYADGEYHNPVTSIDGIIAKDDPNIYDYNIPQSLRDIYARKDYGRWASKIGDRESVAVCFLATNHTSGGNSGSPVINGKGELIGINFDRTWRSTMSDMEFDPTICRNISVDIRYVLFVVDRIGGASYLLDEMDLK